MVVFNIDRRIEQAGGLDSYLLKTPDALLNSDVGSDLRFRIGLLKKQQQFDELKQDIAAVQQERRRRVVELLEAAGLPGLKALAQGPVTAALAQQPQPGGSSSSSSSAGAAPLPQQPAQQQQQLSSS